MKILFIDHVFHKKTHSSDFFRDMLDEVGSVTDHMFDPEDAESSWRRYKTLSFKNLDLVVVWQLEILALAPLSLGVPTVIVPMFDGSGEQPAHHWKLLNQSSFLSFSLNLHLRTRRMIPHQKLVQYFPDPADFTPVSFDGPLKAFFWQRRPDQISAKDVFGLLRGQVASLHVHMPADGDQPPVELPAWLGSYPVSSSDWFATRDEFDAVVQDCNVAVMPRITEGIGMMMLECMARGMCVIAPGRPVHNEYIANEVNGLLFDPGNWGPLSLRQAATLGRWARLGVERGRVRWLEQRAELPAFLYEAAEREPVVDLPMHEIERLVRLYFSDMGQYHAVSHDISRRFPDPVDEAPESAPVIAGSPAVRARSLMSRIPGWNAVKGGVPVSWKIAVARRLEGLMNRGDS